jgi:SP family general alpha glucoside:H+ symporter-like MFS transporter
MSSFVGTNQKATSYDEIALVEIHCEHADSAAHDAHASPLSEFPSPFGVTMNPIDSLPPPCLSVASDELPAHVQRVLQNERELTFLRCCRLYPKAMAWSLLLFCTVVMEAYDKSLIMGFFAFPAFQKKYGSPSKPLAQSPEEQRFEISPGWQMGLQNAAVVCEIIGLLAYGYITYVIGYRKTMIGSLLWMCAAVFPAFFATDIRILLVAQALCGMIFFDEWRAHKLTVEYRDSLGRHSNTRSDLCSRSGAIQPESMRVE